MVSLVLRGVIPEMRDILNEVRHTLKSVLFGKTSPRKRLVVLWVFSG
jgi:hypothetical protein